MEEINKKAEIYSEECQLKSNYPHDKRSSYDGFLAGVEYAKNVNNNSNIELLNSLVGAWEANQKSGRYRELESLLINRITKIITLL